MNKFFPEEMHEAVAQLGTSAEGIKALELIQRSMQQTAPNAQASSPSKVTIEDLLKHVISNNLFKNKVTKIFIHGFLHLLGFNHIKFNDFKKMEKEEEKIYKAVTKKIN